MHFLFPYWFVLLFCLLAGPSPGQSLSAAQKQQIRKLFKEWDSTHAPGGTIGVYQGGKLIFTEAYGMASLEFDVPNTRQTVYNIASVSKQVTAFSLVLLEQQGKLSLDDPVQKHLPEVPDFGEKITLRHLLHHTSGLRNFQNILAMAGWREGDPMTNEDLLRYISRQRELNFSPGAEYLYCNTGFNLATAIVERITGQTFQDWTRDNIFSPLEMKNTGYREDMEVVHKNTATSYNGNRQDGLRQPLKYWTYLGNGNIYTTIDDLARWMDNFRTLKVGGATAIQTLVTPGILNNGDTLDYALGIGVGEYRGLKRYFHGGSIGGYRSYLLYFPEQEFGVIVLSNFSSAGPAGKAMAIADIVLGDRLAPKKENEEEEMVTEKAAAPYTPNKSDLEALAGLYYSPELDTRYQFTAEAGKMRVKHQRHEDFFLEPRAEDQFRATASFFRNVTIIRDASDRVEGIRVSNGRVRNLWFEKIE